MGKFSRHQIIYDDIFLKTGFVISVIVSLGDSLHAMSNPISEKIRKNILNYLLKFFPQHADC